jgi:5,10-methenyltetrahydrofolate synthetase
MTEPSGDQEYDPVIFRAELRQVKIAARQAMPPNDRARASALIEAHLSALLSGPARVVAFCWPLRNEFDCRPLVERLLAAGWRAAQPVVVAPAAPMEFRAWTPATAMTTDRYGIPIPEGDGTVVPDVVLLPLVAFDEQGYRLGYGGGYFDRTLAVMTPRPLAIGVGFELARINSVQPQPHDIRLDAIVTETGMRDIVIGTCIPVPSER